MCCRGAMFERFQRRECTGDMLLNPYVPLGTQDLLQKFLQDIRNNYGLSANKTGGLQIQTFHL
ncbi:unnamed protein product, partial [Heterobilharzia americana]